MKEDEINFLARRFTKVFRRNKRFKGSNFQRFKPRNEDEKGKSDIICHECKKPSHIHQDCPQAKWKKKDNFYKKKVLAITWSGSDDSSDEDESDEEQVNLCFMANECNSEGDSKFEVCIEAKKQETNEWYLDSGCLRHMTGDKSLFTSLKLKNG
ncbi:uncharacterized protein LOC116132935 [Pistacia vera]|uniref:uncharacterized protein LOC116132935 n=1 Tax=Pistacia vera TaxID=55513 RepID=UPI001263D32D|nr:uncharacterized protein LOC116132935 [Pistacia vera]